MLILTRENTPAQHNVATPSHVGDDLGKRPNHFVYINGIRFTAECRHGRSSFASGLSDMVFLLNIHFPSFLGL
jgi:hypothetical protein